MSTPPTLKNRLEELPVDHLLRIVLAIQRSQKTNIPIVASQRDRTKYKATIVESLMGRMSNTESERQILLDAIEETQLPPPAQDDDMPASEPERAPGKHVPVSSKPGTLTSGTPPTIADPQTPQAVLAPPVPQEDLATAPLQSQTPTPPTGWFQFVWLALQRIRKHPVLYWLVVILLVLLVLLYAVFKILPPSAQERLLRIGERSPVQPRIVTKDVPFDGEGLPDISGILDAAGLPSRVRDRPTSPEVTEPPPSICWTDRRVHVVGTQPQNEVNGEVPNNCWIVTGIGADVADKNAVMLALQIRRVRRDGSLSDPEIRRFGPKPGNAPELGGIVEVPNGYAVVGVEIGVHDSNLEVLKLHARQIDKRTGAPSGSIRVYDRGRGTAERRYISPTPNEVLVGFGFEVHDNNVDRIELVYGQLGRSDACNCPE